MQTLKHPCYNSLLNKVGHRSRVYADGRQHYCERCGEKIDQTTFPNIPQDYVTTHDAGDYNKPRPAAPVAGLETVGYNLARSIWGYFKGDSTGSITATQWFDNNKSLGGPAHIIELCTKAIRSQAEAIIAAERAEKEVAERNRDAARENFLTMQKSAANLLKRAEKAEANNAAAKKALEPFADIAGEPWADVNGWTDAACQNDRIVDWFGPSAFLAARAALEAKP